MIPNDRLEVLLKRFEFVEAKLNSNPELTELKSLGQEYSELKPIVENIKEFQKLVVSLKES
jgi:peptide chain release factor 1